MKRILFLFTVFLILVGAINLASAQEVKLGTLAPEGSPWHEVIRDLSVAWNEASNGKLTVRIYPGGIIGDESDMVRKMKVGQLHAAALTGQGLSQIAPEIQALQMPMMFRSEKELDCARDRVGPKLEAILEAKGFKVLTWGSAGWVHIFSQVPVIHPDDLKPLKIFVWSGDTTIIEAYKMMGYKPVPLAATEILTALQSGLIQAFSTTPVAALSFQWFGLARNMADVKWAPLVGAIVITKKKWLGIPDDVKSRLLDLAREAGARLRGQMPQLETAAIAAMKKYGLVVNHVPTETIDDWERIARLGSSEIVGSVVPPDIVAEVERVRDECRARL
jgi:TRAP-type C4-dicarboxylate transport system substrate-binding protein